MTMIAVEMLLVLAGAALLFWAMLAWRLEPCIAFTETDPYAGEVAEFRRQLHDWDRDR